MFRWTTTESNAFLCRFKVTPRPTYVAKSKSAFQLEQAAEAPLFQGILASRNAIWVVARSLDGLAEHRQTFDVFEIAGLVDADHHYLGPLCPRRRDGFNDPRFAVEHTDQLPILGLGLYHVCIAELLQRVDGLAAVRPAAERLVESLRIARQF